MERLPRALLMTIVVLHLGGCASRSALHASREDSGVAEAAADTGPETWSYEAGGGECLARPLACDRDDFGALTEITKTYEECANVQPPPCGDLTMVFDGDGCLVAIEGIVEYSAAFVACVERVGSKSRWSCATARSLHMTQACTP